MPTYFKHSCLLFKKGQMKRHVLFLLLASASLSANAQILTDSFAGTTLNASKWSVYEPASTAGGGSGTVRVNSGNVVLTSRGTLITNQEFLGEVDITGRFRFDGAADRFMVWTRTTGSSTNPWSDQDNGINFRFQQDVSQVGIGEWFVGGLSNPAGAYLNNSQIYYSDLAVASTSLPGGVWLDFRVRDTGSQVELYLGNLSVPMISATTSLRAGYKVSFNNSYNPDQVVSIDSLTIVPEPSTLALVLFSGVLASNCRRRS